MAKSPRIAVIGGGIGGLTAAQAMRKHGLDVTVFEAAPELKEIGAGVSLSPNAMKALRSLDLETPVSDVAWQSSHQLLRNWRTGRIISGTPNAGMAERFGAIRLHRPPRRPARRPEHRPAGRSRAPWRPLRRSSITYEKGAWPDSTMAPKIEADVIVGADGIHSAVRTSLFGRDAPRFTGKICWRCLVPVDAVPGGLPTIDSTTWLGPHGAVVVYLVRRGELVNVVAHYDNDSWTEESWIRECDRQEVIDNYAGWNESLLRLFSASEKPLQMGPLRPRAPGPSGRKAASRSWAMQPTPCCPISVRAPARPWKTAVVLAAALAAMPG